MTATITDDQACKLSLLGVQHNRKIPRTADGYLADVANRETMPHIRLDAISMLGRHCPEYATEAREILASC